MEYSYNGIINGYQSGNQYSTVVLIVGMNNNGTLICAGSGTGNGNSNGTSNGNILGLVMVLVMYRYW